MLLSIVVPVYNALPWLGPMLESLFAQRCVNREIILVDDGSTDGSGELLEAYRRRDASVRVVWQRHQGVSVARNRGLELARGDYIAFADADDVLEPDLYAELMRAARTGRLDVALCNARYLREGRVAEPVLSLQGSSAVRGLDWLGEAIRERQLLHAVWAGVYRTSFLRAHRIRFVPELCLRQDVPWTTEVLARAERVRFLDLCLYRYRVGERRAVAGRWRQIAQCYVAMIETLERFNRDQAHLVAPALPELRWQVADQALRIFHQTSRMGAAEQLAVFEQMRARGTDRAILRNAAGVRQRWRALKRVARMRLTLAFGASASRPRLSAELAHATAFSAPALRRPRAP